VTDALLRYAVVVPTLGRPTLGALLDGLASLDGPLPQEVVVVDDRVDPSGPVTDRSSWPFPLRVVRGWGRGPAAARNLGWRLVATAWVAFLDDDVVVPAGWATALRADLALLGSHDAGSQGRIRVPLPGGRRPTDWERSTAGLEDARWATADMAYRRAALLAVDGFDERFPRAYREDADLALRVRQAGWRLSVGTREVEHPVRPTGPATSVRVQRGNADDALMRRLHGSRWRELAGTGRGLFRRHAVATGAAVLSLGSAAVTASAPDAGQPRAARVLLVAGGTVYLLHVADLVRRRVAPGPRTPHELTTMLWTSALIPPLATWHRLRGWWRHRSAPGWPPAPRAVLLDRDGTLVHDVPYNADPAAVSPVPGARDAVDRLRAEGLRLGVVTNQSGLARGLLSREQVDAVNAEVDARLGPFATWQVCPHAPDDGCGCRKPRPGMVRAAARELGVRAEECVVIGDIGADTEAARAAGARSVLVPTPVTRAEEVAAAPVVAPDLGRAVDVVLGWRHG
jgi:HAD superfamily hydrolase (TIGR01662 family)